MSSLLPLLTGWVPSQGSADHSPGRMGPSCRLGPVTVGRVPEREGAHWLLVPLLTRNALERGHNSSLSGNPGRAASWPSPHCATWVTPEKGELAFLALGGKARGLRA